MLFRVFHSNECVHVQLQIEEICRRYFRFLLCYCVTTNPTFLSKSAHSWVTRTLQNSFKRMPESWITSSKKISTWLKIAKMKMIGKHKAEIRPQKAVLLPMSQPRLRKDHLRSPLSLRVFWVEKARIKQKMNLEHNLWVLSIHTISKYFVSMRKKVIGNSFPPLLKAVESSMKCAYSLQFSNNRYVPHR